MKETEGSANGHIIVLPERLLAKRREPRQRADRGQCSSVGTVTRLLAGRSGNRTLETEGHTSFVQTSRPSLGPTQPPTKEVARFFPGVKRSGREVDHTSPSAGVKNMWS